MTVKPIQVTCPTCLALPNYACVYQHLNGDDVYVHHGFEIFHAARIEAAAMATAIENGASSAVPTASSFDQAVDKTGLV